MKIVDRVVLGFAEVASAAGRLARGFVARARNPVPSEGVDLYDESASLRPGLFRWRRGAAGDRPEPPEGRLQRRIGWPLRLLLAAAFAVPLVLLALAALQNWQLVQVEAEQRVTIEAGELHEHALSALQTYSLVLAWVNDRIRGRDWNDIEQSRGLHDFLSDIETLPPIGAVEIIDPSGHIEASGHTLTATQADASALDAFVAQKQHDAGTFVGSMHGDAVTHVPDFAISRRRATRDGDFDGVIMVAARPDYFTGFFSTVSRSENFSAVLLRTDGSILLRYPPLPGFAALSPDRPIMQGIAAKRERGFFWGKGATDGIERLFGYQHIEGYPLYVLFGIPSRDIRGVWWGNLVDYLWFAVPASFGLFCMTLFAVRQLQRQKVASWRWRTTAQRLKREMDRRTRAEADLHQAQKMEALGQLTGGVAHDFNNVLTVLQGSLELLRGRQHDEKLEARVDLALDTVERGKQLTGQLLTFSRRQPLTVSRIDVNARLRNMAELLTQTMGKHTRITTDLAPDLWPVDTDTAQLELAVLNLAINARDAMPSGGVLHIRTFNMTRSGEMLSFEASATRDFVGLEISDNGVGMPPEVLARAFEPFFTSKGPGKGTGLGLSMVYGLARQSGGYASIRSEVGRGTTITLLLPRAADGDFENDTATDLPGDALA
jgi:two-component system NtrC family sensor kinase